MTRELHGNNDGSTPLLLAAATKISLQLPRVAAVLTKLEAPRCTDQCKTRQGKRRSYKHFAQSNAAPGHSCQHRRALTTEALAASHRFNSSNAVKVRFKDQCRFLFWQSLPDVIMERCITLPFSMNLGTASTHAYKSEHKCSCLQINYSSSGKLGSSKVPRVSGPCFFCHGPTQSSPYIIFSVSFSWLKPGSSRSLLNPAAVLGTALRQVWPY